MFSLDHRPERRRGDRRFPASSCREPRDVSAGSRHQRAKAPGIRRSEVEEVEALARACEAGEHRSGRPIFDARVPRPQASRAGRIGTGDPCGGLLTDWRDRDAPAAVGLRGRRPPSAASAAHRAVGRCRTTDGRHPRPGGLRARTPQAPRRQKPVKTAIWSPASCIFRKLKAQALPYKQGVGGSSPSPPTAKTTGNPGSGQQDVATGLRTGHPEESPG